MLMQTGRRLSKQPALKPIYRLFRGIYFRHVSPHVDYRRTILRYSPYDNIYYCCTQKTGSQWFKRIFRDPVVYQYTGLRTYEYNELGLRRAHFDGPLPERTIAVHLYVNYDSYASIPKPQQRRTFFMLRDPRDIAVSWYFSARYSHGPVATMLVLRKDLENTTLSEGLRHSINSLHLLGLFDAQRSWMEVPTGQREFEVFRYEDFARDNQAFMRQLFDYLRIDMPEHELHALCDRHRFKLMSGGRDPGIENVRDHYRKGTPGDWKNYFDQRTNAHFREVAGDLLEVLGYRE